MRALALIPLALLLCFVSQPALSADLCGPFDKAGEKCQAIIDELFPTQFDYGSIDSQEKMKEMRELSKDARKAFLKGNRVDVVVGPGGKFYLVDGHHHSNAAHKLQEARMFATVKDNLSHLSEEEFWAEMVKRKWARLKDASGKTRTPAELPKHVKDLADDPYRSLAWLLRKSGAFEKTEVPYAEFDWADYLRTKISREELDADFSGSVKKAITLASADEAANLPGYIPRSEKKRALTPKACWANFKQLAIERF
jgi:hypothetical protein